jgi:Putative peptidoglycan binding domain
MKYAASALALALGLGLAVAAQAQGTTQNAPQPFNSSMPSAAPAPSAQNQPAQMQQQPQIKKQRHAKNAISHRGMSQRNDIRQVQLRLKQEGLFKGKVTGKMDRQTKIALNRFEQQNGLPRSTKLARINKMLGTQTAASGSSMPQMRTAHLNKQQRMTRTARVGKQQSTRIAHARMPKSETTGVGSSMPNKPTPANTPVVNPSSNNTAPTGAGNGSTTPPSNPPANQPSGTSK